MNNGPLIFFGIFFSLALSWLGLVVANNADANFGGLEPYMDEATGMAVPALMPGLARQGQRVYQDLGCATCHTQQVRREGFGADVEREWGTRQSVVHDELRSQLRKGGVLTLQSRLDLADILRPKVQPGSTLDYQWPQERVTLVAHSSQPLTLTSEGKQTVATRSADGRFEARLNVPVTAAQSFPLTAQITVKTDSVPDFAIAVSTNEDDRLRALPLRRFFLPWTPESDEDSTAGEIISIAELEGGNWGKGRRVFHS